MKIMCIFEVAMLLFVHDSVIRSLSGNNDKFYGNAKSRVCLRKSRAAAFERKRDGRQNVDGVSILLIPPT